MGIIIVFLLIVCSPIIWFLAKVSEDRSAEIKIKERRVREKEQWREQWKRNLAQPQIMSAMEQERMELMVLILDYLSTFPVGSEGVGFSEIKKVVCETSNTDHSAEMIGNTLRVLEAWSEWIDISKGENGKSLVKIKDSKRQEVDETAKLRREYLKPKLEEREQKFNMSTDELIHFLDWYIIEAVTKISDDGKNAKIADVVEEVMSDNDKRYGTDGYIPDRTIVYTAIRALKDAGALEIVKRDDGMYVKGNSEWLKFGYQYYIDEVANKVKLFGIDDVDKMEGHQFEYYCADMLRKIGYTDVEVTRGSGDQGVDVIAVKEGMRYAIQCKRYSSPLGNTPVQEVNAGKQMYHCHVAVVLTNQYFTSGAKELAEATGVLLWDRDELIRMIERITKE